MNNFKCFQAINREPRFSCEQAMILYNLLADNGAAIVVSKAMKVMDL